MEYISDNEIPVKQEEEHLFRLLDRGIDDMEAGRELSIDEAFQRVDELRERSKVGIYQESSLEYLGKYFRESNITNSDRRYL